MAEEGWEEAGGRQRGVVTHSSGQFWLCTSNYVFKRKKRAN
jgi:hypothetical protein